MTAKKKTAAKKAPAKKAPAKKAPAKKAPAKKVAAKKPATASKASASKATTKMPAKRAMAPQKGTDVVLLSGGNPQIAKGDGDAPVQAYLAALPGWKSTLGKQLDALVEKCVPGVKKAVKWNSPFYGVEGNGWFLSVHAFNKYLKLAFFRGADLRPLPPGESKNVDTRYLDLYETDVFDEAKLSSWFEQAAAIPGWDPSKS